MGRKRIGTRKYLYLSIAGMLLTYLAGCESLRRIVKTEFNEDLLSAQRLLDQGEYAEALKKNRTILSKYENSPPADKALYNIGIIYAHHGNPEKDHEKSLQAFQRLAKGFPQSPLAREAEIWTGLLKENGRLREEIGALKKRLKETKLKNQTLNREIEDVSKNLEKTKKENEELIHKIEDLERTISETKQVDIEIEQKKKELSK